MNNTISSFLGGSAYGVSPKKGSFSSALQGKSDPVSEFLAYQKLTPQEKIVDSILKKYGLTKEDLGNLSAEELQQLQEEIKAALQQEVKNQLAEKGMIVDMSA